MFDVLDIVILVVIVGILGLLFWRRVRTSEIWQATVTPLASIIGSGFLVVAPLLAFTVGNYAIVAIIALVAMADRFGSVIRFNIKNLEPILAGEKQDVKGRTLQIQLERLSKLALALAYIVSITFYLKLLASFVLERLDVNGDMIANIIATSLLVLIGGVGFWRGLKLLEQLEEYSVNTKLAIIGGFLFGLAWYNIAAVIDGSWSPQSQSVNFGMHHLRVLLGTLLITQGFETSRYLGNEYKPELRRHTMRYAQVISAGVYIVFIGLVTVLFGKISEQTETEIINLSSWVSPFLPYLLILGAVFSQFSAAVADTVGSGGMFQEVTQKKIQDRTGYAIVAVISIVLVWSVDVFAVVAYASRAFALYYAIQCAQMLMCTWSTGKLRQKPWHSVQGAVLLLLALSVAIFGLPVE